MTGSVSSASGVVDQLLDRALSLVPRGVDADAVGGDPGEDDAVVVEGRVEQVGVVLGELVLRVAVLLAEAADGDAEGGATPVPGDRVAVADGVDVTVDLRGLLVHAAVHLVRGQHVGADGGAVVGAGLLLPAVHDAVGVEGLADDGEVAPGDLQGLGGEGHRVAHVGEAGQRGEVVLRGPVDDLVRELRGEALADVPHGPADDGGVGVHAPVVEVERHGVVVGLRAAAVVEIA